ncbi:MAG: hypothetical protein HUU20_16415 [Pirellulales bacterium]|nr:hypothetical protein [Pirellulales bacterium]
MNRPSGLKPSTRPSTQLPSTGIPSKPGIRPGADRPNVTLPETRPSTRPETLPSTRPSLPGLGGGGGNLGALTRPNLPGDGSRPGLTLPNRPGGSRPSPGDVGDFLGLDRPVTLPAEIGNRPSLTRPDRPGDGNWPGTNRPGRPGGDWPNIGDINIGNNVINKRPGWVNIDNDRIVNINNQWNTQIGGLHNWHNRYPDRTAHWGRWGNDVRHHWGHYHDCHHWFSPDWWYGHHHGFCGWHYYHGFHNHAWSYWWTVPTFVSCVNWFTWTAPATVWTQPIYYDYGEGGNVVYQNNNVYVNGQQVATAEEFAQSAASLATVPPPASQEEAAKAEWMPLGTFAVAADEKDVDPSRVIQLAVSKEGIVSGTLYNTQTDQAQTVQGQVDKQTQRVAFRVGEGENIVAETGLYNLTQNEAPVLIHFGAEKVETYLLVRLEGPQDESGQ